MLCGSILKKVHLFLCHQRLVNLKSVPVRGFGNNGEGTNKWAPREQLDPPVGEVPVLAGLEFGYQPYRSSH